MQAHRGKCPGTLSICLEGWGGDKGNLEVNEYSFEGFPGKVKGSNGGSRRETAGAKKSDKELLEEAVWGGGGGENLGRRGTRYFYPKGQNKQNLIMGRGFQFGIFGKAPPSQGARRDS